MKVWGITENQLDLAISETNLDFDNNITFNRKPEKCGKAISFTITVKDSKAKGAKFNPLTGRRIKAACFHVHYRLIDKLFLIGATRFKSTMMNVTSATEFRVAANKQCHTNMGSIMYPFFVGEDCNC